MPVAFASITSSKQNAGISPVFVHGPPPAGLMVGELIVAVLGTVVTTAGAIISGPPTWTKHDQSNPTTIGFPKCALFSKIADAGDLAGGYTFTNDKANFAAYIVGIFRLTGALGLDGFSVAFVENIVQATMPTPSLVTVADNSLIIRAPMNVTAGAPATNVVPPAGITEKAEEITTSIFGSYNIENVLQTPPGPTGIETFTHDGTSSSRAVMYTVGVAPVPVPPGAGPPGGPRGPFRILGRRWRVLGTGA